MNLNNSFIDAQIKFFNMTDLLKDKKMKSLDLSDIEEYIQKDGRDLLKHLLLGHIEDRGIGDIGPGVIGSDGIKRTHKRIRIKKIKTLFGKIEINRIAYSVPGVSSLFPLDAMLNLPKIDVSYNLQKYFVLEIIKTSFDESIESIERWTEVKISKYQAKKIIIESANDFSEFYDFQFSKEKREAKNCPLSYSLLMAKELLCEKKIYVKQLEKKAEKKRSLLNAIIFSIKINQTQNE